MGNPALANLVDAARGGDRAAFERLVVELQDMAVAVCYGRLGNRELAREAAQDAFVDAYLHLAQLNEPAAFRAWFHRVLLKHCDRAVRRKRPASAPLEQLAEQARAQSSPGAEAALLDRERDRSLRPPCVRSWRAIQRCSRRR